MQPSKLTPQKKPSDPKQVAQNFALLKRHCFAAPYYKLMNDMDAKKSSTNVIEINYRDDESIYFKADPDRLTVIFSIAFKDANDIVLAKVFLQEYADARRTMNNTPSISYSQKEPPAELKGVKNLRVGDTNGFVSFVLHPPHMVKGPRREKTIDTTQTFRNYLHYHMKCSKAHLHTRMRNRVRTFLQILNRAKSEPENKEKKTMTGRTFKRADDTASTFDDAMNI